MVGPRKRVSTIHELTIAERLVSVTRCETESQPRVPKHPQAVLDEKQPLGELVPHDLL